MKVKKEYRFNKDTEVHGVPVNMPTTLGEITSPIDTVKKFKKGDIVEADFINPPDTMDAQYYEFVKDGIKYHSPCNGFQCSLEEVKSYNKALLPPIIGATGLALIAYGVVLKKRGLIVGGCVLFGSALILKFNKF